MNKSISILISGHGVENESNMFFKDATFKTVKDEFADINDIIDNVRMISQVGRWGGVGLVDDELNKDEMIICKNNFDTLASERTETIMETISATLPKGLKDLAQQGTTMGSTRASTIIRYIIQQPYLAADKIKKIFKDKFKIQDDSISDETGETLSHFVDSMVSTISSAPMGTYTTEDIFTGLLRPFGITRDEFIDLWRNHVDLGMHQLFISDQRGTTYSLIRPCINKLYDFYGLEDENYSGIHVLDIRMDGSKIQLPGDIIQNDFNVLYPNFSHRLDTAANKLLDEITSALYHKVRGKIVTGKKKEVILLTLHKIITDLKKLGYTEINIIDNSCRVDEDKITITQFGNDATAYFRAEKPFRERLKRCEIRQPIDRSGKCAGESKGQASTCTISGGNLKLHDNCAPYAADIIIKYLDKTYQKGTDKLQKQSLQFIVSLFGKDIIQYLDNRKNTLSTLRDIMINKYFNADQHWRKKAYLICKDKHLHL
jgi:hypothetical protein